MVIISTTEHSMPNSRSNTSNVSDPHSSIDRYGGGLPLQTRKLRLKVSQL